MTARPPASANGGSRIAPRIGLALGGGSARGLAHIVVLEAFDQLGIKPSLIAGTSMGAICGAAYAAGLSAAELREHFARLFDTRARFFRRVAPRLCGRFMSLVSPRVLSAIDNVTLFEVLLPDVLRCDFAALKIPFLAVAADFYANAEVVIDSGPVIPALAASCALPTLSRPVVRAGRVLIDGGYVNPLPHDLVIPHADRTVAVDVTGTARPLGAAGALPGGLQLLAGATQMLFCGLAREKLKAFPPDVLIRPDVASFASLDFFRFGEILTAAVPAREQLKEVLARWLATG
jgi:NTE family protein